MSMRGVSRATHKRRSLRQRGRRAVIKGEAGVCVCVLHGVCAAKFGWNCVKFVRLEFKGRVGRFLCARTRTQR